MTKTPEDMLIEQVKIRPALYDSSLSDYRDVRSKEEMWKDISQVVGWHAKECQARWKNLRDHFVKELRKASRLSQSGFEHHCQWRFYEALTFLEEFIKPKQTPTIALAFPNVQQPTLNKVVSDDYSEDSVPTSNPVVELKEDDDFEGDEEYDGSDTQNDFYADRCMSSKRQKTDTPEDRRNRHEESDEDELFCRTLVPLFKDLDPEARSRARIDVLRLLHEAKFGGNK